MKKVFVVVMDYEENTESMFTEMGIESSLDNQLWELKEAGHIESYECTDAYEIKEETQESFLTSVMEQHDFNKY